MPVGKFAPAYLALVSLWVAPLSFAAELLPPSLSGVQVAEDVSRIIWCYDEDRDLVTRKEAWKCTDRIIDDAQARKFRIALVRWLVWWLPKSTHSMSMQRLGDWSAMSELGSVWPLRWTS